MLKRFRLLSTIVLAIFLAGCGEGGKNEPENPPNIDPTDRLYRFIIQKSSILAFELISSQSTDGTADIESYQLLDNPTNAKSLDIDKEQSKLIYQPEDSFYGDDKFIYSISTTDGLDLIITVNIHVNNPPLAAPDNIETKQNQSVNILLLNNDDDVDGVKVSSTLEIIDSPHDGIIENITYSTGEVTYVPNNEFIGQDSFRYRYADDLGQTSNIATVSINVSPTSTPTTTPDSVTTNEDESVYVYILLNDQDNSGLLPSSVNMVTTPTKGSVTYDLDFARFNYIPNTNIAGDDSFLYQVTNKDGVISDPTSVEITILPVNDSPIAEPDSATIKEGITIKLEPLLNDSDVDDALDCKTLNLGPSKGDLAMDTSSCVLTYRPLSGFIGDDVIPYTVTDSANAISTSTITVTVKPNLPPVATNDTANTNEDEAITIDVTLNDIDDVAIDSTSLVITSEAEYGSIINNNDGSITYTPDNNYSGMDSFTYTITDSIGQISDPATVNINVDDVNDPPTLVDDQYTVDEGVSLDLFVLSNDTDIDTTNLIITAVDDIQNGTVINNQSYLTYQSNEAFSGVDVFTYSVSDGTSTLTASVTIQVNLLPPKDLLVESTMTVVGREYLNIYIINNGNLTINGDIKAESLTVNWGAVTINGSVDIDNIEVLDNSDTPNKINITGSLNRAGTVTINNGSLSLLGNWQVNDFSIVNNGIVAVLGSNIDSPNWGTLDLEALNLTIDSTSILTADHVGADSRGRGCGWYRCSGGGGYGGIGGSGYWGATHLGPAFGVDYDYQIDMGGAGAYAGGGKLHLKIDNLLLAGSITSNGRGEDDGRGGGAGGGILLDVHNFANTGTITAIGGRGGNQTSDTAGGGSGGRIKIFYNSGISTETIFESLDVSGGARGGYRNTTSGQPGSVWIDSIPKPAILDLPIDGVLVDTSTPTFSFTVNDNSVTLDARDDDLTCALEISTDNFTTIFQRYDQKESFNGWSALSYTDNELASFTVPDDLPEGTYQWRVFVKDKSISSDASVIRTFTVN